MFKVYLSIVSQRMGSKVVDDNLALWLVFIYLSEIARIGANVFQRKPGIADTCVRGCRGGKGVLWEGVTSTGVVEQILKKRCVFNQII